MKEKNDAVDKNTVSNNKAEKCTIKGGHGNLIFFGDITISGRFQGNLHVNGTLRVDANAVVSGGIIADYLYLSGSCSGTILINKECVLYNGSFFSGHLISEIVDIEDGCVFKGNWSLPKEKKSGSKPEGKAQKDSDDEETSLKSLFGS